MADKLKRLHKDVQECTELMNNTTDRTAYLVTRAKYYKAIRELNRVLIAVEKEADERTNNNPSLYDYGMEANDA